MTPRPLLLALALLLPGCALKTTMAVMDAEQAVHAAESAGARESAVHDVTMARAYMEEAQRQWARSQYGSADRLAAEAKRLADQAAQKAAMGGDPGQALPEDLVAPPPVEETAPTDEPDDSELMQLIEEDKEEEAEKPPSIMEEEKLDSEIFEEEGQ